MVEGFEQDDFDILDPNAKRVLMVLGELEEGVIASVDLLHKKTGLMPNGLNDAVRHLTKANLIEIVDPQRKIPPYNFYAIEITDLGRQVIAEYG